MMNRRGSTDHGRRNSRKDGSIGGDEDLLLFRDMQRRDKDRIISLLQPVSDDFESNSGNYPIYRIPSAKRGLGLEFVGEGDKNDYDWLKTPPATPLFPSIEIEANNAPELAIHREITIIQPLSRFAGGNSEASKVNFRSKSPISKPKIPSRSTTPSITRPSSIVTTKATRPSSTNVTPSATRPSRSITPSAMRPRVSPSDAAKTIQSNSKYYNNNSTTTTKLPNPRENTSNPAMNTGKYSKSKPSSRGVSPLVRSRILATIPGFSDETPPNLRTDRSSSASRDRPMNPTVTIHPKQEPVKPRRQSCSPSMSRGRKSMESNQEMEGDRIRTKGNSHVGNGSLAFGSKLVEKVMNARKSVSMVEEKETKLKIRTSSHETSGFGRMMSKSSLDTALKHMEIRQNPIDFHKARPVKNAMFVGVKSNLDSGNLASQVQASCKRKETGRFHSKE